MALPFFYKEDITTDALVLDEDTSKHVTGVLRMKVGESILLTDGKGTKATAVITDDHRKRCAVNIVQREKEERKKGGVAIAISLVKNAARFEWFLEKATEMGVSEIIPLLCQRTEKEKFREERLQQIITSAMLQSQQVWMPRLHAPTPFEKVITRRENINIVLLPIACRSKNKHCRNTANKRRGKCDYINWTGRRFYRKGN